MHMTTTRPYLIRAFYEWIVDNECTPYIAVDVTVARTEVPKEYVDNGKIILNVSMSAVRNLSLNNDCITFSALFGGRSRDIYVPIQAVIAIYAKENGKGMVFAEEQDEGDGDGGGSGGGRGDDSPPPESARKGKPNLTLIK